ncbi:MULTISPECIES: nitrate/nitrite transporter NrtS [unclassified Terrabacter]|uniref:nitrate/nitrite transporter NrtS n=1 Tax=unclassified Terrabacter TaxID=2630222 RepID=UPI000AE1A53B|nr:MULTISPECIES: nitrate/nitrite transporter NrtS [unclassified Terrabacter]
MNDSASTWSTPRELLSVALAPQQLKRTVSVMLVVGTAFFAMNQLGVILAGRATALVWVKAALTYLTPFCVSNFGLLSATRRMATVRVQPSLVESDAGLTHTGQRAMSGKEQGHG